MELAYMVCTPDVPARNVQRGLRGELAASFRYLADLGYHGVELMIADPNEVLQSAEDIRALAASCGLRICAVNTDEMAARLNLNLGTQDSDEYRRAEGEMRKVARLARVFECCFNIGLVRGNAPEDLDDRMKSALAVSRLLGDLASIALREGCMVVVEPVPPPAVNWLHDAATVLNVVVRVNRPTVRILLNTASVYQTDPPFDEVLRNVGLFVRHIHLSDEGRGVPGTGAVDFAGIIRALGEHGYNRWLTVDVEAPDQREAARRAFAHLEGMIPTGEP